MLSDVSFVLLGNVPINSKTLIKDIKNKGSNKSLESLLGTLEALHAFITLDFVRQDIDSILDDRVVDHIKDIQFYSFTKSDKDKVIFNSINTSNCCPDFDKQNYSNLGELLDDIESKWQTLDNFLEKCTDSIGRWSYSSNKDSDYERGKSLRGNQSLLMGYILLKDFIVNIYKDFLNNKESSFEKWIVLSVEELKDSYNLTISSNTYKVVLVYSNSNNQWSSISYTGSFNKKLSLGASDSKLLMSYVSDLLSKLNQYYDITTSAMFKPYSDAESISYNKSHSVKELDKVKYFPSSCFYLLPYNMLYVSGIVKLCKVGSSSRTVDLKIIKNYIKNTKTQEQKESKASLNALKKKISSKEYATVYISGNKVSYLGSNPEILKYMKHGVEYKSHTYYVVDDGFFYLLTTQGINLHIGTIEPLGTGACIGIKSYMSKQNEGNSYGDFKQDKNLNSGHGLNLICDSREELKEKLSTLEGKSTKENQLGMLQKESLPYRYCSLVDVRDTLFGVLLFFENSIVYISKVSLKVYVNFTKTTNKEAIENAKKAVKLPVIRQLIKKVNYTYSVYEVSRLGATLSASSSYSRKFIKRYPDILDVLNLSKSYKDLYFRVRVYDTNDKCFNEDCVVHDGSLEV